MSGDSRGESAHVQVLGSLQIRAFTQHRAGAKSSIGVHREEILDALALLRTAADWFNERP